MNENNDTTEMCKQTERHVHWWMTAVCSTVALVALVTEYDGDLKDEGRDVKWAVSAVSIVLSFSWIAVMANAFVSSKFASTMIEGGVALLTCGFWAACLPAIMDPDNALAVGEFSGGITNSNLYFFSWGGFIFSFLVLTGFMQEKRGGSGAFTPSTWGALCMTSLIAMVSGSRLFENMECSDLGDVAEEVFQDRCDRTALAVSIGAIIGIVAAIWMLLGMFLTGFCGGVLEVALSVLALILWTFGVGYITFGDEKAPATQVGNLYFFTWGSFALSVMLFVSSMKMFMDKRKSGTAPQEEMQAAEPAGEKEKPEDIEKDVEVEA